MQKAKTRFLIEFFCYEMLSINRANFIYFGVSIKTHKETGATQEVL